jgi:hypothetical protein
VSVLTTVVDRTGKGDVQQVRSTFDEVMEELAKHGYRVAWPVSAEIVNAEIMGATRSPPGRHELSLSIWALRTNMLDGLIAHEAGHMIRTEAGHPSHDPRVYGEIGKRIRFPADGLPILREAFNNTQDIYADDIAFVIGLDDRAYDFFASWIDGHVKDGRSRNWDDVGKCISNGFALGNLVRRGLLAPSDDLWSRARAFDASVGLRSVDEFAAFFAALPKDPRPEEFMEHVERLASLLRKAAQSHRL